MAPRSSEPRIKREIQELLLLFEISQSLYLSMDLRNVVGPVLESIVHNMGMQRGTLTLLDRDTEEIFIEAAHSLSESQKDRGKYGPGEGVTGKVVKTGRPAVVPHISDEPLFLDSTGARKGRRKEDVSFICVPIK